MKYGWIVITLLLPTHALAEDSIYDVSGKFRGSYLCIPDAAGGVSWDSEIRRWKSTKFNIDKDQFILRMEVSSTRLFRVSEKSMTGMVYNLTINEFGEQPGYCFPRYLTDELKFDEIVVNKSGYLYCGLISTDYKFNLEKMRYMKIYTAGFIDGEDNDENTPYVEVGKCSRVN